MHSSTLRASTHCLDSTRPCNPCLDATKACNLNETCRRQRSAYIDTCNKGPQDGCNRKRCHKSLRQFFDRVQTEHSYGLLFCSCPNNACAERRRQTIVPSCSFEEKAKPNCLELRRTCRLDPLCRSRLADFHKNCQMTPVQQLSNSCPNEDYQACLAAYVGLIGTDMTPNYMDSTPTNFTISPWCSCRGSGNQEEECERFLQDFRENTCLRNAIQAFGYGTDRPKPATVPPTTLKPDQEVSVGVTKTTQSAKERKPDDDPCAFPTCNDLEYGEKCNPACGSEEPPRPRMEPKDPENRSVGLRAHAWLWITCLTPLLGILTL
ncbi:GDNF family receptor alpha-2-like [Clupea harengus]|uniref:GDNF family receptor alpha-2-like n=1 Tax=Clupea harengus TaxID=7950 RepID=A0A6P8FT04_CLUHA|nr:GDNF family receptor alpha-2-like [Clupea harengus]